MKSLKALHFSKPGYMSWYEVDLHVLQKDAAQDPWGRADMAVEDGDGGSGHAMAAMRRF